MNLRRCYPAFVVLLTVFVTATTAAAQSPITVADVAARINRERISRGLVPYALSPQLTAAAQTQAADLAKTGKYSHIGSDGSHTADRVARAGYGAYSWGRRVGENYAVYHDLDTAMGFWMNSRAHRDNVLHRVYREIGVGIASSKYGGTVFVVDFGAQPNVLPVFIDNGSGQTPDSNVTLSLTNEDVYDGAGGGIGDVRDVEISNDPNFGGATWRPFADHIEWTLAPGNGTRTVYVKYRDDRGRTAQSSDSVAVEAAASQAVNTPAPSPYPTKRATVTSTRTKTPSPTPSHTVSATATSRPTKTATATSRPKETRSATPVTSSTPAESSYATGTIAPVARFSMAVPVANATNTETVNIEAAQPAIQPASQPAIQPPNAFAPTAMMISIANAPISTPTAPNQVVALSLPTQRPTTAYALEPAAVLSASATGPSPSAEFDPTSFIPFASGFAAVGMLAFGITAIKRLVRRR